MPDTLTIDYNGRPSTLTITQTDRQNSRILLSAHVDGEWDEHCWFTRSETGQWRWPSEGGWAALVAAEVAAWLETHWQASPETAGGGQDG